MHFLKAIKYLFTSLGVLFFNGCHNPYTLDIAEINYDAEQTQGVIQITDAKLYSREALINERRDEIQYLEGLLKKSETLEFEPQIIRELETITAFSAALKVSANPTSALNFKRDIETSSVQQKIDALKLQLQLESLQSDAALFREQIAERAEPSTDAIPSITGSSDISSSNSVPSMTEINTSIDSLITRLDNRLKAQDPLARNNTNAKADPSDLFLDRAAYRDLIKSAMSAERLDDLHDKNGNALMRFHFGATVLPPKSENMDTLGVLRMEVEKTELSEPDIYELYLTWMNYLNNSYNIAVQRPTTGKKADNRQVSVEAIDPIIDFIPNPRIFFLGQANPLFKTLRFDLPRTPADENYCGGINSNVKAPLGRCLKIYIAMPTTGHKVADATLSYIHVQGKTLKQAFREAYKNGKSISTAAGITSLGECKGISRLYETQEVIDARQVILAESDLQNAYRIAIETILKEQPNTYRIQYLQKKFLDLNPLLKVARALVNKAAGDNIKCNAESLVKSKVQVAPDLFIDAVKAIDARVRVYDVSPRERAQQISTVTRAAEAISLAAAIAGELPQAGIGVDAQSAFSRSVSGKADARERAPLVVSFAEPAYLYMDKNSDTQNSKIRSKSNTAFGWLLGPKVAVNPEKKNLELLHQAKPYELTADLSMPGWWPYVTFEVQTAWAPNWRKGSGATITRQFKDDEPGSNPLKRRIRIPLAPNDSDMASLNTILLKQSSLAATITPVISDIEPKAISACAAKTTLRLKGDNIWRSEKVIVGGMELSGNNVRVTPDMSGVLVDVDARALPQAKTEVHTNGKVYIDINALNQDGEAHTGIALHNLKADGSCDKPDEPTIKPKIDSVNLDSMTICNPNPSFTITGKNLTGIIETRLGNLEGNASKNTETGVTITLKNPADIKKKLPGLDKVPLFIRTPNGAAQTDITIKTPKCPNH